MALAGTALLAWQHHTPWLANGFLGWSGQHEYPPSATKPHTGDPSPRHGACVKIPLPGAGSTSLLQRRETLSESYSSSMQPAASPFCSCTRRAPGKHIRRSLLLIVAQIQELVVSICTQTTDTCPQSSNELVATFTAGRRGLISPTSNGVS